MSETEKTPTYPSSNPSSQRQRRQTPPPKETNMLPYWIAIGVLALLALVFGGLWTKAAIGPDYEAKSKDLSVQLDTLTNNTQNLRQMNAAFSEQLGKPIDVGFEVQMGAFRYFDLSATPEELARMSVVEEDGIQKYVLGRFSRFEDAEAFVQDLREMGLTDAFMAGVVNGERSTVAEAKAAAKEHYGW